MLDMPYLAYLLIYGAWIMSCAELSFKTARVSF